MAKPKYALLIYNALKSNTLSPHASSVMRRWQRQEGGGESWVTTLSPCLAVFVFSCACVCECGPGLVSAGAAAVILGRCPGGGRFGLSSWRCRVRIRQPPNVRKATRVRFMINMRYNTKYTINKQAAARQAGKKSGRESGRQHRQTAT